MSLLRMKSSVYWKTHKYKETFRNTSIDFV